MSIAGEMHRWDTADFWPDWSGVESCDCGVELQELPEDADTCPQCGQELRELVYPHCVNCGDMIVGEVWSSEFGDDYHPRCAEPIEL